MKRTFLAAALAATALAGVAVAQPQGHGPSGGPGFGLLALDANADGKVTRAELDSAQGKRFQTIDANRDGFATPEEFKAAREKEHTAHSAEMATRRFAALDADSNGQISKSEFEAAATARKDGDRRDGAHGRRGPDREFRAGGPGGRHGMGRGGPADGKPGRLGPDADADGKVSLAEFSARAVEGFTRADTNKDGVVTIAELQAAGPGRR
jgi:EF hand